MKHFLFFLFLLLSLVGTAIAKEKVKKEVDDYSGFHIGTVSGGGFAISGGDLGHPAHANFNLELGYDFDNQLDLVARIGYGLFFSGNTTSTASGVVTLPHLFKVINTDFGIRYVPFSAKFSPYFVQLLGAYTSSSDSQGEQVFESQTGFHEVSGIGLQYRTGKHHLIGLEMATQFFLNDVSNVTTLDFSLVYRFTF